MTVVNPNDFLRSCWFNAFLNYFKAVVLRSFRSNEVTLGWYPFLTHMLLFDSTNIGPVWTFVRFICRTNRSCKAVKSLFRNIVPDLALGDAMIVYIQASSVLPLAQNIHLRWMCDFDAWGGLSFASIGLSCIMGCFWVDQNGVLVPWICALSGDRIVLLRI